MPGITPWWASSRRQIRQSPNFLNTARGRPHCCSGCSCAPCTSRARGLRDQRFLGHLSPSPFASDASGIPSPRRSASACSSVCGGGRDRDVEAADLLDGVVVDLREDDLLAHARASSCRGRRTSGRESAEVADARKRDRDQPVEELPHPVAAQRDARADRHALADLELGDRLAGAAHLGALAGDDRQLVHRGVEHLRIGLRLADAHVQRDLRDARHLHDRRELELLLQLRAELVVVALLEARHIRSLGGGHHVDLLAAAARLQTRTLIVSPLTSFVVIADAGRELAGRADDHDVRRPGRPSACSMIPPGIICVAAHAVRVAHRRGFVCRVTMFRFSTITRPSRGCASRTRPCLPRSLPASI